ncbi:MAG: bifunctional phosphopantothenoylcysteine decarboxylase/phosphopantothenate--cysteine ligase CoaBC [Thermodesulfobacteriota bacterium]
MLADYLQFPHLEGKRLHLGVSGSIAAYKSLELLRLLKRLGLHVGVTLTAAAQEFIQPLSFSALGADPVFSSMFGPGKDIYAHLVPGQEAQALVVAPATANSLAKMAWGLADDMLSCQVLSFPGTVLAAPAMNPNLWLAQATQDNVARLKHRGFQILEPDSGEVACQDQGQGRLPELEEILFYLLRAVTPARLAGKRILVSMGPTREFWDPVRFWSNPSSGKMGAALAISAWIQGAEVDCVCGPHQQTLPQGIRQHPIETARQMHEVCLELWPEMDIGCLAAAVCDFRPESFGEQKFKKASLQDQPLRIEYQQNPDILQELGSHKTQKQRLIGFAAETGSDLEKLARGKLQSKNLDLIVANHIGTPDSGFSCPTNRALILDWQRAQELPLLSKGEVAWRIWQRIIEL